MISIELDYFAPVEFSRCIPSCSKEQMSPEFMERLNKARRLAGLPFVLNSAFRSSEYDMQRGRTGNSYHCKGRAVDIKCLDSSSRGAIVRALIKSGFRGIGISNTFIHVDDRPNMCIWLYE